MPNLNHSTSDYPMMSPGCGAPLSAPPPATLELFLQSRRKHSLQKNSMLRQSADMAQYMQATMHPFMVRLDFRMVHKTSLDDFGIQDSDSILAVQGVPLHQAVEGVFEHHDVPLDRVYLFLEQSNTPIPWETDVSFLGGRTLVIRPRDPPRPDIHSPYSSPMVYGGPPSSRISYSSYSSSRSGAAPLDAPLTNTTSRIIIGTYGKREGAKYSYSAHGPHQSQHQFKSSVGRKNTVAAGVVLRPSDSDVGSRQEEGATSMHGSGVGSEGMRRHRSQGRLSQIFPINSKPEKFEFLNRLHRFRAQGLPTISQMPDFPFSDGDIPMLDGSLSDMLPSVNNLNRRDMEQQQALWELITTEASYIRKLHSLVQILAVFEKLQSENYLNEIDQKRVFGNVLYILICNIRFWLTAIAPVIADLNDPDTAALNAAKLVNGFLNISEIFEPYIQYFVERRSQETYVRSMQKESELFREYILWSKQSFGRLDLADVLVFPTQRLTKYPLLLKAIRDRTTDTAVAGTLGVMIDKIEHFLNNVHLEVTCKQNMEVLVNIQKIIENYEVVEPFSSEVDELVKKYSEIDVTRSMRGCHDRVCRSCVHFGDLKMKEAGNAKFLEVHCILFTDMLLICKQFAKRSSGTAPFKLKVVRPPFHIDKVRVQKLKDTKECGFLVIYLSDFDVVSSVLVFHCANAGDRDRWMEVFEKARAEYIHFRKHKASCYKAMMLSTASDPQVPHASGQSTSKAKVMVRQGATLAPDDSSVPSRRISIGAMESAKRKLQVDNQVSHGRSSSMDSTVLAAANELISDIGTANQLRRDSSSLASLDQSTNGSDQIQPRNSPYTKESRDPSDVGSSKTRYNSNNSDFVGTGNASVKLKYNNSAPECQRIPTFSSSVDVPTIGESFQQRYQNPMNSSARKRSLYAIRKRFSPRQAARPAATQILYPNPRDSQPDPQSSTESEIITSTRSRSPSPSTSQVFSSTLETAPRSVSAADVNLPPSRQISTVSSSSENSRTEQESFKYQPSSRVAIDYQKDGESVYCPVEIRRMGIMSSSSPTGTLTSRNSSSEGSAETLIANYTRSLSIQSQSSPIFVSQRKNDGDQDNFRNNGSVHIFSSNTTSCNSSFSDDSMPPPPLPTSEHPSFVRQRSFSPFRKPIIPPPVYFPNQDQEDTFDVNSQSQDATNPHYMDPRSFQDDKRTPSEAVSSSSGGTSNSRKSSTASNSSRIYVEDSRDRDAAVKKMPPKHPGNPAGVITGNPATPAMGCSGGYNRRLERRYYTADVIEDMRPTRPRQFPPDIRKRYSWNVSGGGAKNGAHRGGSNHTGCGRGGPYNEAGTSRPFDELSDFGDQNACTCRVSTDSFGTDSSSGVSSSSSRICISPPEFGSGSGLASAATVDDSAANGYANFNYHPLNCAILENRGLGDNQVLPEDSDGEDLFIHSQSVEMQKVTNAESLRSSKGGYELPPMSPRGDYISTVFVGQQQHSNQQMSQQVPVMRSSISSDSIRQMADDSHGDCEKTRSSRKFSEIVGGAESIDSSRKNRRDHGSIPRIQTQEPTPTATPVETPEIVQKFNDLIGLTKIRKVQKSKSDVSSSAESAKKHKDVSKEELLRILLENKLEVSDV